MCISLSHCDSIEKFLSSSACTVYSVQKVSQALGRRQAVFIQSGIERSRIVSLMTDWISSLSIGITGKQTEGCRSLHTFSFERSDSSLIIFERENHRLQTYADLYDQRMRWWGTFLKETRRWEELVKAFLSLLKRTTLNYLLYPVTPSYACVLLYHTIEPWIFFVVSLPGTDRSFGISYEHGICIPLRRIICTWKWKSEKELSIGNHNHKFHPSIFLVKRLWRASVSDGKKTIFSYAIVSTGICWMHKPAILESPTSIRSWSEVLLFLPVLLFIR